MPVWRISTGAAAAAACVAQTQLNACRRQKNSIRTISLSLKNINPDTTYLVEIFRWNDCALTRNQLHIHTHTLTSDWHRFGATGLVIWSAPSKCLAISWTNFHSQSLRCQAASWSNTVRSHNKPAQSHINYSPHARMTDVWSCFMLL